MTTAPRHVPVGSGIYPVLVAISSAVFLVSNINASKGVEIGPLVLDAAFFLFPISYIVGDVLAEVYGFRGARRAIFTAFGITLAATICFYIGIWLPPASFYENQAEFALILGLVPQIVLASLAGYAVGQLLNAWSLVVLKKRTGESSLWVRLIGSTVVGQFGDTLLFCAIAAPVIGITTMGDFANYVIVGFVWKTALEAMLLPVTYAVVRAVKRREGYHQAA
ncbi:queuosine precursor transporter [Corynebacterium tapiri]|nr:queuosine precursor transporter [Corynebacterium tapiri]